MAAYGERVGGAFVRKLKAPPRKVQIPPVGRGGFAADQQLSEDAPATGNDGGWPMEDRGIFARVVVIRDEIGELMTVERLVAEKLLGPGAGSRECLGWLHAVLAEPGDLAGDSAAHVGASQNRNAAVDGLWEELAQPRLAGLDTPLLLR
jgi:hypothetical protein